MLGLAPRPRPGAELLLTVGLGAPFIVISTTITFNSGALYQALARRAQR